MRKKQSFSMVSLIKFDFSFEILKEKSLFSVHLACYSKKQIQNTFSSLWFVVATLELNFWPK